MDITKLTVFHENKEGKMNEKQLIDSRGIYIDAFKAWEETCEDRIREHERKIREYYAMLPYYGIGTRKQVRNDYD